MVTIELNDKSAADVKCIKKLRSMGLSDDEIQELYNSNPLNFIEIAKLCEKQYGNRAPTNGDRIRAMSDEELAKFFGRHGFCCDNLIIPSKYCIRQKECSLSCVVNWLRQPTEGE